MFEKLMEFLGEVPMIRHAGSIIGGLAVGVTLLGLTLPPAFAATSSPTVYDLWNELDEFEDVSSLRELLIQKNWASDCTDLIELDHILVLTQQLSDQFFDRVTPALALAVISAESGFNSECQSPRGAAGLMQVVPKYHTERIEKYRYDENVDLYDPRLNIMVGMDYLDYILSETEGDLIYALMWYNGGARYAVNNYIHNGIVTEYASMVMQRMVAIQDILDGR